eukprot:6468487-Amphidinium_carterae.1
MPTTSRDKLPGLSPTLRVVLIGGELQSSVRSVMEQGLHHEVHGGPADEGLDATDTKTGYAADVLKLRPITILSLVHRVWSSVRFFHLQKWSDQVLHPSQSAFRQGRSAKVEVHKLIMCVNERVQHNKP